MKLSSQSVFIQAGLNTSQGPIATRLRRSRRKKAGRVKLPGSVVAVSLALLVLVLVAVVLDQLLDPKTFPIQSVRIVGDFQHLKTAELQNTVSPLMKNNFFALDLNQVRQRLLALPWVDDAVVRRVWPRTIELAVRETRILTRWGQSEWLSSRGTVIKVPGRVRPGLPILQGPRGMSRQVLAAYLRWDNILQATGLRIIKLQLQNRGSWSVQVVPTTGQAAFVIRLGRDEVDQRLLRFAHWYPSLLSAQAPAYIDMRYPNGFALGPRKPAAQEKG